jgi:hypothetical protein
VLPVTGKCVEFGARAYQISPAEVKRPADHGGFNDGRAEFAGTTGIAHPTRRAARRALFFERLAALDVTTVTLADPLYGRERLLRDVVNLAQRAKRLQRPVFDLPDPLARDVERPPHLVEGARLLAVQAVAQLEDPPLAVGERPQ